jgi:hypothetical protein
MSQRPTPQRKFTRQDLRDAAEKYKNWGKWGPDDEIGTLNYTSAEDIIAAARLVKKGKVISLALNFDQFGPQGGKTNYPPMGRINPLHLMLRTGTDAYSGVLDKRGIRASDDVVVMPLQSGTQWDGLGHIFYENYMWNGYDCREVTTAGAQKCGIEKTKNKMVGRGVFLDVPGRLSRRRRARLLLRDAGMGPQDRDRGNRERHLGMRGSPQRERSGHQPALALDHHPDHGDHDGGDIPGRRARQGLHGRQDLRVHVRRSGNSDHRRGRLAGQSARDQVSMDFQSMARRRTPSPACGRGWGGGMRRCRS